MSMMGTTKQCKQCGEILPIEQFRKYYGGRSGTYTMCKACERINSRAKYLERKGDAMNDIEREELDKIYKLYEAQRAYGLNPPKSVMGKQIALVDTLDSLIDKYSAKSHEPTVPTELAKWISCPLTEDPEYYLDEVYEDLKKRYRPVLRIDPDTLVPIYDETYGDALERILARFNDYEDEYYTQGD